MIVSLGFILIVGYIFGRILDHLKLPSLIGYILAGVLLGPSVLNLLDDSLLAISSELRRIALIIILLRAGLNLSLKDLKKVGRPAVLMSFLPATIEILGTMLLAPLFFDISYLSAAILGTVIAATSPAVVVARMLDLMAKGFGVKKSIPQMILAGSSIDDIFVIILFTSLASLAQTGQFYWSSLFTIPSAIILGILAGLLVGWLLSLLIKKLNLTGAYPLIITLGLALLFDGLETALTDIVGFSSLIAIMAMGFMVFRASPRQAAGLANGFNHMWQAFEIILFVLVGASISISYVLDAGFLAALLIILLLLFRSLGVFLAVCRTDLNKKEKLFTMLAYTPKATVQAAIGGVPLAMGLPAGQLILTISVVAIIITAPLGAILIDTTHAKFLNKD